MIKNRLLTLKPDKDAQYHRILQIIDKKQILIIDCTSRTVIEDNIESEQSLVDISSLSEGVYIVMLKGPKYVAHRRFIKN